jgi:transcriptional regulator with XRE-family HTH domain
LSGLESGLDLNSIARQYATRMRDDFSRRLRYWLDVKGMTRTELARALQVTPSAVSKWCAGAANPTLNRQRELVSALGLTLPEFYGRIGRVA